MIARLILFVVIAALAVVAAERLRGLLPGSRPGGRRLRRDRSARPAAEIEQATRCPDCGAWVLAGASCRCGQ